MIWMTHIKKEMQVGMGDEIEHTQWPDCQTWGKRKYDNQCQRERGKQAVSKELTWS